MLIFFFFTGLALKSKGYDVRMFTSFHDPKRCFDETRNGTLPVIVMGNWYGWYGMMICDIFHPNESTNSHTRIPRHIFGSCYALCAYLRMIYLAIAMVLFYRPIDIIICDQVRVFLHRIYCVKLRQI